MLNTEQTFVNGAEVQPMIVLINTDNDSKKIESCRKEINNKSFQYIENIEEILYKHNCKGLLMDLDEFIRDINTFDLSAYLVVQCYNIL